MHVDLYVRVVAYSCIMLHIVTVIVIVIVISYSFSYSYIVTVLL